MMLKRFVFLIAVLFLLGGSYFRCFENYELSTLDTRFRLRPTLAVTDKVVIIEIGDDTIKQLGRFPFDRSYHALLVSALKEFGAKAVLFDIFFSETGSGDREFELAMKTAGNVYLPYVFEMTTVGRKNVPLAQSYAALNIQGLRNAAKGMGHINLVPDSDGKYRRIPLFVRSGDGLSPYLSFRLLCDYLNIPFQEIKFFPSQFIQCGKNIRIPLDEQSNAIINYAGEWGKRYQHYSYVDILKSYKARLLGQKPELDPRLFHDKICLIGLTATGTTDLHPNAFAALYPSLAIHADLINSILTNQFIVPVSRAINTIIVFALLLLTLGIIRLKPLKGLLTLCGLLAIYIILSFALFILRGIWLDVFYPLVAVGITYLIGMLFMYIKEWKKRVFIESELQVARKIQQSFLPKQLPSTVGLEVAVMMHTAHDVGGDLYDFIELSPHTLGIMIGDVSGKGIPASLFMSMVSGAFKFFALADATPAQTLLKLNEKIIPNHQRRKL